MKITVYVLSTCIPDENSPVLPSVFASSDAAEAYADERLREEWASLGPCDDEGEVMRYPDDWREANDHLSNENAEWGQWELTSHEIDLGALAVVIEGGMIQSILTTGALAGQTATVIDYDVDGGYGTPIPLDDGWAIEANVSRQPIEASERFLPRALDAIAAHNAELGYGEAA